MHRWLDAYILRWVPPVFTSLTAFLAFFLDIDVKQLRGRYPRWPGLFDRLEGLSLYSLLFWSSLIAAVGACYNVYRSGSLRSKQRQIDDLNLKLGKVAENVHEIMDNALRALCDRLQLDQNGEERVSIYIHKDEEQAFVPCGRFSYNPTLKKKGRTSLPDSHGCIALAWSGDWHFADQLSDPSSGREYENEMATRYKMPRATLRKLRMKPRTIIAKRLSTEAGPLAVIVLESTKPNRFQHDDIRARLEEVSPLYAALLVAFLPYIPDPQDARDVGL